MSTPEVKSEVKVPEAPVTETPMAPEVVQDVKGQDAKGQDVKGQTQMSTVWAGRDRVPSDWSIVPAEGEDMIEASNSSTGRVFAGTVAEFNQKLRG